MIDIIKKALQALIVHLEWKSKYFYYEIYSKSLNKQKEYANEIEALRSSKTNDAADKADLLVAYLVAEQKFIKEMSEYYNKQNPTQT